MSHKSAKRARKLARTPASLYDWCRQQNGEPFMDMASKIDADRRFVELFSKSAAEVGASAQEVQEASADLARALSQAPGAAAKLLSEGPEQWMPKP